jgi:HK97 family phage portal protein
VSFVRTLAAGPGEFGKLEGYNSSWLADAIGGKSHAGLRVTEENALKLDTVVACVRLLSETIGGFPLKVYAGELDGDREPALRHPTYALLHDRPNPTMPPVTFWGLAATHLVTWGESFLGKSRKRRSRRSQPDALWPIEPGRVRVELRNDGEKLYWIKDAQGVERDRPYTADEIIHIIGFTRDGVRGLSPVTLAAEAIGAGLAIDEYTNRFFANGAVPTGVLETDRELTDPVIKRLERSWERRHRGRRRAHRIAILEQGLKYHAISLPLRDLEFVALQQLSAKKICRIYRVPASLIDAESEEGKGLTYRNVQTDNLRFLQHTLSVWLKRIAQSLALDTDLFPAGSGLFPEHVVADLLAMDSKTEAEVFEIATGGRPWMLPSEVRRIKNLPAADDLDTTPMPARRRSSQDEGGQ